MRRHDMRPILTGAGVADTEKAWQRTERKVGGASHLEMVGERGKEGQVQRTRLDGNSTV